MKKISCKICDSEDIIVEVTCKCCGNKYKIPLSALQDDDTEAKVNKKKFENFLTRAQEFYEEGDFDKTVEYCNKVLDIDTDNVEALTLIAKTNYSSDYKKCEKALKKIFTLVNVKDFEQIVNNLTEELLATLNNPEITNPNYIFSRTFPLLKIQTLCSQLTKKKNKLEEKFTTEFQKLVLKFYPELSNNFFISTTGRVVGEKEDVDKIIGTINTLNSISKLNKQTQQDILNITSDDLKEFFEMGYTFFSEGRFNYCGAKGRYVSEIDKDRFSIVHDIGVAIAKPIVEICCDCDSKDKKRLCKIVWSHYEEFKDISWEERDGNTYTFNDNYKETLESEAEFYNNIIYS